METPLDPQTPARIPVTPDDSSRDPRRARLLVAGGGTGGHVLAGVAVAEAWRRAHGGEAEVLFVGARGGIEEKLVPRAGFPLELLDLGALNRVSMTRRVQTLFQLPFTLLRSWSLVRKFRPRAVLGVGGYASGPVVLVARLLSRLGLNQARTAILEQNTVAGMTNRILGRFVDLVFSAFPGTEASFPGRTVRVTGNPVRSAIGRMPAPLANPFTIFIFGGSQGALGINSLVLEALPHLGAVMPRLRFIHQTGERDHVRVVQGYADADVKARVEKFIHDMSPAYAEASLVICRAGSSTLSEIAAVGRPAVLIPFPHAADNHQETNARVFVDAGAAMLVLQGRATGEDLAGLIIKCVAEPARLAEVSAKATTFHRPDAAGDIARGLEFSDMRG